MIDVLEWVAQAVVAVSITGVVIWRLAKDAELKNKIERSEAGDELV